MLGTGTAVAYAVTALQCQKIREEHVYEINYLVRI